ncbi:hypothetical protein V2A60_007254 [Cordyceps javanica]
MPCGTMFKTLAYAALLSSFAAANLYQVPLSPSKFLVNDDFTPKWDDKSCTISRSTAYEVHEGPNTFSTSASDPINSIKISPVINKTNWEQWEFDGISHTGISLMMVMFSRDHSFYFFGKGNLRMEMFMTTPDGKHHTELQYLEESIILDCPDYTYGLWNSSDKSYSFYTTKDLKHTKLVFDSPGIRGTYKLTATTPPVHADGSAPDPDRGNAAEATELSPDLYYSVPVAGGEVEMDAVLPFGRKLAFKGRGGSARLWAKQGWLGLSASWVALRAWAGPYELGVGEGLGMSDFADRVVGGEVNGPQYEGRGLTEQAKFPEYIPQWAIFLLYGVGFFGNGKDYVVDFFRFWLPSW